MIREENDSNQSASERSEEECSTNYQNQLMELYKFYAGTADAVSTRRQSANAFFLTLNTALIALIGYSFRSTTVANGSLWPLIVAVVLIGLILCYQWRKTIKSHQQLNEGKFEVIGIMEEKLPFAPYAEEWKALGEGKDPKKYQKITDLEMRIPCFFAVLHIILLSILIWQQFT